MPDPRPPGRRPECTEALTAPSGPETEALTATLDAARALTDEVLARLGG